MADVHTANGPRAEANNNYTRKMALKPKAPPANNLGELQISVAASPHRQTRRNIRAAADILTKQRKVYKDMVKRGICNVHLMFTKKAEKHTPFFNCPIRKELLCHRCGHKGHMTAECLLMDSSMKTQSKKAKMGAMDKDSWLGKEGNYQKHFTFEKGVVFPKTPSAKKPSPVKPKAPIVQVSKMPDYNAMTRAQLMDLLESRGFTRSTKEGQLRGPQAKLGWLVQTAKDTHV